MIKREQVAEPDPDEEFYPAHCMSADHHWPEDAVDGDTCNCGEWYRFRDRMTRTDAMNRREGANRRAIEIRDKGAA